MKVEHQADEGVKRKQVKNNAMYVNVGNGGEKCMVRGPKEN